MLFFLRDTVSSLPYMGSPSLPTFTTVIVSPINTVFIKANNNQEIKCSSIPADKAFADGLSKYLEESRSKGACVSWTWKSEAGSSD